MSLLAMLKPNGPSGFGYGSTADEVTAGLALAGRTILVTGSTSGLGFETVRVLAARGAGVIATARDAARAEAVARALPGVRGVACDLADPASVRACVARLRAEAPPLDAVICNAGIMALPRLELIHGVEAQFFTNHIGHFLLVTGLIDHLAPAARVVMLSSSAHRWAPPQGIDFGSLDGSGRYAPFTAYGQSKFANLVFARELARRFAGSVRTANAVHPGVIAQTSLKRHLAFPLMEAGSALATALVCKTIAQGAATQCYVAVHPAVAGVSGRYFADCNEAPARADADDAALGRRLWQVSEEIAARLA
jgi:NAD(P)-dependent dehydrogenase (short-subunit alcohol dehydrogenase family)